MQRYQFASIIMHISQQSAMGARETAQKTRANTSADEAFLHALGERVRDARARRGMTRRILANASGVSERYLAQLESGHGNVSVLLLQRIAGALHLALTELLHQGTEQPLELALIGQFLQRLPVQKLSAVRAQLMRDYGTAHADRMKRIALIGLRGAGKSTLGSRLAKELGAPFIELDREVERDAGTSLSEIFLLYGQAGYRRYERRCLEKVVEKHERAVIATGGSIVSEPGTYDLLLSTCCTVWLKARPEEHMARVVAQGDIRPIAGNREAMEDLHRILRGRTALYGRADVTIDTANKSADQSLAELRKAVAM
jgi:XRE family aerobic/anaerobic benzoate catabolism transcriptional regulator